MKIRSSPVTALFSFGSPFFFLYAFFTFFILGEYTFRMLFHRSYAVNLDVVNEVILVHFLVIFLTTILTFACVVLFSKNKNSLTGDISYNQNLANIYETAFISRRGIRIALVCSLIPLVFLISLRTKLDFSNSVDIRQALQSGGASYFLIIFQFFYKAFGIYFFEQIRIKKHTKNDILILFILIAIGFYSGFSSLFLYLFLTYWIFKSARYREKVLNIRVLFLVGFSILLAPIYNWYRMLKFTGVNVSLNEFLDYLYAFRLLILSKIFDRFDYFDNLISGYGAALDHHSFHYAFNLFVQPIPRGMMSDKPYNFSSQMTTWVYPENMLMGISANFGFINEFILYFGYFGIPASLIIFFVICIWATSTFIKSAGNTVVACFYALVLWPYMGAFVIGYWNDMAIPSLLINSLMFMVLKRFILKKSTNPTSSI